MDSIIVHKHTHRKKLNSKVLSLNKLLHMCYKYRQVSLATDDTAKLKQ